MATGLAIEGVSVRYGEFEAVTDASLTVEPRRTLAIVGESGSGKTTLALAVARLLPPGGQVTAGRVRVGDVDVTGLTGAELRRARGRIVGYIPQDAMAALNPVARAGRQIGEVFELWNGAPRRDGARRAVELLGQVGIRDPERAARSYPHELSGGMRQRVMIAMALALEPQVLVADEPTTALDVTVQAEILALVAALQAEHGMTLVWITHDMGVVAELADEVAVMYGGRIVERGAAGAIFGAAAHPYTKALLGTLDGGEGDAKAPFRAIPGTPPSGFVPPGCPFHPRCASALAVCAERMPPVTPVADGHTASCHLLEQVA